MDETWVNIAGHTWYLVVFLNEHGKVLDALLEPSRRGEVIARHLKRLAGRMRRGLDVLVSDDFSTYKGVVFDLGQDIVHMRHIHKPPYGRVAVDAIK